MLFYIYMLILPLILSNNSNLIYEFISYNRIN
jgi:hypothetical protein